MTCYVFQPRDTRSRPQCQCGQVRRESHVQKLGESEERVVGCAACCSVHGSGERVAAPVMAGLQVEIDFESEVRR